MAAFVAIQNKSLAILPCLDKNDPILLNVNRQEYRKNLDYLVYEIDKVKKIIQNIRLFMIGIGSQHDHLKQLVMV